jgi:peptide/nickel transport system permease protein
MVATITFLLGHALPSDPARMMLGPQARPQDVERVRRELGLEAPLLVQYRTFLGRTVHVAGRVDPDAKKKEHSTCASLGPVHVDLGRSYQERRPVVDILADRIPRTFALALAATLLQAALGLVLGVAAARRRGTWKDGTIVGASLVGVSAPTFVTGLALQYVLAKRLQILPLDGFGRTTPEHLVAIVLPSLTLALYGLASYTRLVRDAFVQSAREPFVRTARAKGASATRIAWVHQLGAAAVPLVTVLALDFGALLGGAAITESLFRWPGIGEVAVRAVLNRDGPVVLGTVLVSAVAVILVNGLADLFGALWATNER